MYAFIVKNNQNTWDIWEIFPNLPFPEKEKRLQDAIKSGFPIVGKNVTEYKTSVKNGSTWDGKSFSGGESTKVITEDSKISVYAYICNNVVVLLQYREPGTEIDEQLKAIFESDTTVINIPEGQTARPGDIWDGHNIIKVGR